MTHGVLLEVIKDGQNADMYEGTSIKLGWGSPNKTMIFSSGPGQAMSTIYFLKAYHTGIQYHPVLTQYHQVPTSTALYWSSIQWFDGLDHVNQIFSESISHWQPVPPCLDPVSTTTDLDHHILTQYHQVTTSAALYRPSAIKYQSVPFNTD